MAETNAAPPKGQKKLRPRAKLTMLQVAKLQCATFRSGSTVRRWAKGYDVADTTDQSLSQAARRLGIEVLR